MKKLFLLCCAALVALASAAPRNNPKPAPPPPKDVINPVSSHLRIESHHSLHTPLDKSQVYWNFGGSTVLTKNFIRLTPSTQDRRGWLWNEYPLEAENWEVEFKVEVFSKPHFGGDGFGFWVIAGEQDPSFGNDPEALSGPVFGMKNDFKGFGVIFDVYDNDNRRNNPSVFVLKNDGKPQRYNHDNDYEDDMYTQKLPFHIFDPKRQSAHKCVADLRNTGKVAKVLVKYQFRQLHVYVDTQETTGYKYCLSVSFGPDDSFLDYHLAFTSATGQVADNMDIVEVTTRYMPDNEKEFDDHSLRQMGDKSSRGWSGFFWTIIALLGLALTAYAGYELATFRQMMGNHLDTVRFCQQFNTYVLPHYFGHIFLTLLLMVAGNWLFFLLNLGLVVYRVLAFTRKQHLFVPTAITPNPKVHGSGFTLSLQMKQALTVALYVINELYFFNRLLDGI